MSGRLKKPTACVLGSSFLTEKIGQILKRECRVFKDVLRARRVDYIFYLKKGEREDLGGIIEVAVAKQAKLLVLLPQATVGEETGLVFNLARERDLDIRVVKVSSLLFEEISPATKEESFYFNNCAEKILEAMFGSQSRGGLFILPEPPFVDLSLKGGEQKKSQPKPKKEWSPPSFSFKKIILFFLLSFFVAITAIAIFTILGFYQLSLSQRNFLEGDSHRALVFARGANLSFLVAQKTYGILTVGPRGVIEKGVIRDFENFLKGGTKLAQGAYHLVNGVTLLEKPLSGLLADRSFYEGKEATRAKIELTTAQENLAQAQLILEQVELSLLPFGRQFEGRKQKINTYRQLLRNTLLFLDIAPEILGMNGKKTYLVLLQNNMELRPTGGFIGSYGLLSFERGKLLSFEVFDVYSADGQLRGHVDPPAPIRKYLEQPHWFLRDSNWEPDFKTSGERAAWFLEKEVGQKVDGVVALDVSLAELIVEAIGPINLSDYQEMITRENLLEKAHFYAQGDFFPGSRGKADFLGALTRGVLEKLRGDKSVSWPRFLNNLRRGAEEKHLLFTFNDPDLQNLISLNRLGGALPMRLTKNENFLSDFLMLVEANVGVNKVNYSVKRNISATINVSDEGKIAILLKIVYTNHDQKENYKNFFRVIVPQGARMGKIELDGEEVQEVEMGEEIGRSILGALVNIPGRSQKTLTVGYELADPLPVDKGLNIYNLQVFKQPGTLASSLMITVNYPAFLTMRKLTLGGEGRSFPGGQTLKITTNLSQDREFEIEFLNK